jgi:hypothetical protein
VFKQLRGEVSVEENRHQYAQAARRTGMGFFAIGLAGAVETGWALHHGAKWINAHGEVTSPHDLIVQCAAFGAAAIVGLVLILVVRKASRR